MRLTKEEKQALREREEKSLRARVEKIFGKVKDWHVSPSRFEFRIRGSKDITLKDLIALSEEFGTDAINFNCGISEDPGYSEVTPGAPASPGYIQVMFPVKM